MVAACPAERDAQAILAPAHHAEQFLQTLRFEQQDFRSELESTKGLVRHPRGKAWSVTLKKSHTIASNVVMA